jgi:hypothetical protein
MKSQDIVILLKLISLEKEKLQIIKARDDSQIREIEFKATNWKGWEDEETFNECHEKLLDNYSDKYSARGLSKLLGISKSEVNSSIKRSIFAGLGKIDWETGLPTVNSKALFEFLVYGLKYVFPAQTSGITRGIPTSFAAPILEGKVKSAGELIYVWPDPQGKMKGESVTPLYKSVPFAVRNDYRLYQYLALIDALRLGLPRETNIAIKLLGESLV